MRDDTVPYGIRIQEETVKNDGIEEKTAQFDLNTTHIDTEIQS